SAPPHYLFLLTLHPPPRSTLFPYTTLFRSQVLLELYAAALGHLCTLKQREEALREADRRKDQSLAMLVHELRNPLAPIKNAVERSEEHTSELQSRGHLVCRLLLEKKNRIII